MVVLVQPRGCMRIAATLFVLLHVYLLLHLYSGGPAGSARRNQLRWMTSELRALEIDSLREQQTLNELAKVQAGVASSIDGRIAAVGAELGRARAAGAGGGGAGVGRAVLLSQGKPVTLLGLGAYQDNAVRNAVDGDFYTRYWSFPEPKKGQALLLDLQAPAALATVSLFEDAADRCAHCDLFLSDNESGPFRKVPAAQRSSATVSAGSAYGKYKTSYSLKGQRARFVKIGVSESNSDHWWQLYELQVTGTAT